MVEICFKILDRNLKHRADPADDVSARCNSIYVGRVISAMVGQHCMVLKENSKHLWAEMSEGRVPECSVTPFLRTTYAAN